MQPSYSTIDKNIILAHKTFINLLALILLLYPYKKTDALSDF